MGAGITLTGFAGPFVFVPVLPELLSIMQKDDGDNEEENPILYDKASGIYNTSCNLGFLLTPMMSGLLTDLRGYEFTCDFFAMFSLTFALVFYLVMILVRNYTNAKARNLLHINIGKFDSNK